MPLNEDTANKLIAVCDRSPFGRKFETLMDDSVHKSWQLESHSVKLENPLWHSGMEKLVETIADRIGQSGVHLQCKVYKLLVYAEGGHFAKHRDTEKADGMIATLVIQPPSFHEGGTLIVYRNGVKECRHDFGKSDGKAAYLTHYAVYYADAEHSLEQVTKGHRLALVYSICLPPGMLRTSRNHYHALSEDLASAICKLDIDDSFALLQVHKYTEKSIIELGCQAFKGVDRARFNALEEANEMVPTDKKLLLFLARLDNEIKVSGECYRGPKSDGKDLEYVTWFSNSGRKLGRILRMEEQLNFLNTRYVVLALRDKHHQCPRRKSRQRECYKTYNLFAYAVVAWSEVEAVNYALKFINVDATAEAIQQHKVVDVATVSEFMDVAINRTVMKKTWGSGVQPKPVKFSVEFFCTLSQLLVMAGSSALVNRFFIEFWGRLHREADKKLLIPSLTDIARAFSWSDIGTAFLTVFAGSSSEFDTEMAFQIADGLDTGVARATLLKFVVDIVVAFPDEDLCDFSCVDLLWKCLISCEDKDLLKRVARKFLQMDAILLGTIVELFPRYLAGLDENDDKRLMLSSITAKREKWLNHQIRALDKPFSWEMPNAVFPDNA